MRRVFPEPTWRSEKVKPTHSSSFEDSQAEGGNGNDEKDLRRPIAMTKQFSLPVQEHGPLEPTTLAAVRRARLLLSYFPATEITSRADFVCISTPPSPVTASSSSFESNEKDIFCNNLASNFVETRSKTRYDGKKYSTMLISDCVVEFIQSGSDPDLIRRIADERSRWSRSREK